MPNLRILYENTANDYLTVVASSEAGSLAVENLMTDIKAQVWRSTGLTESVTLTWTDPVLVGCVALPFCNLTSEATIRVRGYTNVGDGTAAFDTGVVAACAYAPLGLWDWGMLPLGVNAFSYGGGTYANAWTVPTWVREVVVDLVDTSNAAGYIEASRIVVGSYWEATYNPEEGSDKITNMDSSKHSRSDAGDLLTEIGTRARKLSINQNVMTSTDRAQLMRIIRGNGLSRPMYVSLFPEDDDALLEQSYQMYCKFSGIPTVSTAFYGAYSASLDFEEI